MPSVTAQGSATGTKSYFPINHWKKFKTFWQTKIKVSIFAKTNCSSNINWSGEPGPLLTRIVWGSNPPEGTKKGNCKK